MPLSFPHLSLRLLTILICLTGIALTAWTTATGPHHEEHHVWDWDAFPYILIAFGLSTIYNSTQLLLSHLILPRPIHPGTEVGLDLFLTLALPIDGAITLLVAIDTLQWDANHWSNDEAYRSYFAYGDDGILHQYPGRPYTPCSGFEGDCERQRLYTEKTHHRATVEIGAVGLAFAAGVVHLGLFVWACVRTHRYNKEKKARQKEALVSGTAQNLLAGQAWYVVPTQEMQGKGDGAVGQGGGEKQVGSGTMPRYG